MLVPRLDRRPAILWALFAAIALTIPYRAGAETQAQTCDRLAGDAVKMDSIDGEAAQSACSNAVASAPQDKHLQYEYARTLERSGKRDQAKQIYQWIAGDGYAPANAALARLAGPLTGEAAGREKFAQKLDAIAAIAARIARSTPRDHDDPNTVLGKTGKDSAKILAWVKANTRIVPYAGMLRGASGVLMDRSGNSLDRALFLADLLHRAGYNVRIARAQIPPEAAEALRVRFVASAPKPAAPAAPDKAAVMKAIGSDPRLDPKIIEQAVDKTIAGSRKFNTEVQSLYGKVLPAVLQAIGNDPTRDARLAADADAVLRDHFWVQRQNGSNWDDLDPDVDVIGRTTASATFLPSETPSDLKHRVTLRLTIEVLKSGKFSEVPLLQQTWLPSEIAHKSITISHSLYPQPDLDAILKDKTPQAAYLDAAANASVVMPVLRVDTKDIPGQIYNFSGEVEAPTAINLASMGGAAIVNGSRLASGIASAFGESAPAAMPAISPQASVTAEWLEIDIAVPGKSIERHRRAIFDMIGAEARANPASVNSAAINDGIKKRRALALSGTIDAYLFDANPSAAWAVRTTAQSLAAVDNWLANSVRKVVSPAQMLQPPIARVQIPLWSWATGRMYSTASSHGVPAAPNVALLWQAPELDTEGATEIKVVLDIVSNDSVQDTNFLQRVSQGVEDTVIERMIVAGDTTTGNTASVMANDLASGHPWSAFRAQDEQRISGIGALPDVRMALQKSLAQNKLLILRPDSPVTDWWEVDSNDGRTRGVENPGYGASMAEYAFLLIRNVATAAACVAAANHYAHSNVALAVSGGFCVIGFGVAGGYWAAATGLGETAEAATALSAAKEASSTYSTLLAVGTGYAAFSGK